MVQKLFGKKIPQFFSSKDNLLIFGLVVTKLLIHFLTNTTYGLQRDAYLYIAQSEHLDWGFISIPPFTAFIIAIERILFGDSVFALRLLPALAGAINIILIALMVKEMGGKTLAIFIAGITYLVSPAFLRSNLLLQPVSFNHMFWLLAAYLIVLIINRQQAKYWIWLGIVGGIGFLTKYSIVFFFAGFILAMLVTKDRKWLATKYPYIAAGISFLIVLPNLIWQYNHNWPVIQHMAELRETQLVHVEVSGFLLMQLLMNFNSIIIWIAGLFFFLIYKPGNKFRFIGLIYIFTITILIYLSGKFYYSLGLYPMLFAGGGIIISNVFKNRYKFVPYVLIGIIIVTVITAIPFSLPIYSYPKMVTYGKWASNFGMRELLRWEDGNYYELPQDYADMTGWEETAKNVAEVYHSLSYEQQEKCLIYADNYGQAGAINFYRKKYNIPEAISFNGSFVFWIPDYVDIERAIYIMERKRTSSDFFNKLELKAQVQDPYARDKGYVFLCSEPMVNVAKEWNKLKEDVLSNYRR